MKLSKSGTVRPASAGGRGKMRSAESAEPCGMAAKAIQTSWGGAEDPLAGCRGVLHFLPLSAALQIIHQTLGGGHTVFLVFP
jgi:hypothetical protein